MSFACESRRREYVRPQSRAISSQAVHQGADRMRDLKTGLGVSGQCGIVPVTPRKC